MSSPVENIFKETILINKAYEVPIYLQIANQIATAIQNGIFVHQNKLPGSRKLSQILGVHRKTIIAAYDELQSQDWVEIKANRGTFIKADAKLGFTQKSTAYPFNTFPKATGYSFKRSNLLESPHSGAEGSLSFNDGQPDVRLSQAGYFSKFYSANLKRKNNQNYKKLSNYNTEGSEYFKHHFSKYLNESRGIHIDKSNLLITRSTEMSFFILSKVLISPGDLVVVGVPGFFGVNMVLQEAGAHVLGIPVDEDGIDTFALEKLCTTKKIRLLYVASHHHYPTTVSLSTERRIHLHELALRYGFVVVEDDYDFDFNYEKTARLPLVSANSHGMIVYMGTFGKSLMPGFRTGFIVAPENLIYELRKYLGIIDRQGDILMEQTLGEIIEDGEINRHLKKSLVIYRERRDYFYETARQYFSDEIKLNKPSGGLAFWWVFNKKLNISRLADRCQKEGLLIPRNLLYQDKDLCAMRLGFGHFTINEISTALNLIYRASNPS